MVGAFGAPGAILISTGLSARGVRHVLSLELLTDKVYESEGSEAKVAEAP
jgi:hypothetical protein